MKLMRIRNLPTDTVAQWVEDQRDNPRVLGSNPCKCHIFLFVLLCSFFLCYPGEALEGPILTGVCFFSTMLIQITTDKYRKIIC